MVESHDHLVKLSMGVIARLFEHFDFVKIITCTEMHVTNELYWYRQEGPFFDCAIAQLSPGRKRPCKVAALVPKLASRQGGC